MYHPHIQESLVRGRQADLIDEARRQRLVNAARDTRRRGTRQHAAPRRSGLRVRVADLAAAVACAAVLLLAAEL